eukprot:611438-Prymnesium_polylepis.2
MRQSIPPRLTLRPHEQGVHPWPVVRTAARPLCLSLTGRRFYRIAEHYSALEQPHDCTTHVRANAVWYH